MQVGDVIVRKSYQKDMKFTIVKIINHQAILNGLNYRLIADADLDDLECVESRLLISNKWSKLKNKDSKLIDSPPKLLKQYPHYQTISNHQNMKFGRILHLDGNMLYFKKCCSLYKKLNLTVDAYCIKECHQPLFISELLSLHHPDILILTGHDSMTKEKRYSMTPSDYKNSRFFVESIKAARKVYKDYDDLIIFAGGCQSNYEALMNAGANFASAPKRSLINIYDPVYVASILSTSSISTVIDLNVLLESGLFTDTDIGGLETRGKTRIIKPGY